MPQKNTRRSLQERGKHECLERDRSGDRISATELCVSATEQPMVDNTFPHTPPSSSGQRVQVGVTERCMNRFPVARMDLVTETFPELVDVSSGRVVLPQACAAEILSHLILEDDGSSQTVQVEVATPSHVGLQGGNPSVRRRKCYPVWAFFFMLKHTMLICFWGFKKPSWVPTGCCSSG